MTRTEIIKKYEGDIAKVSELNPMEVETPEGVKTQQPDMGVAFDMLKANTEAKTEGREPLYKVPAEWDDAKYAEFAQDLKTLE